MSIGLTHLQVVLLPGHKRAVQKFDFIDLLHLLQSAFLLSLALNILFPFFHSPSQAAHVTPMISLLLTISPVLHLSAVVLQLFHRLVKKSVSVETL